MRKCGKVERRRSGEAGFDGLKLCLMRDINGLQKLFPVDNESGMLKLNTIKIMMHDSCDDEVRCTPSRLRYSVFRSQGTCGGRGVDVPDVVGMV